MPVVLPFNSVFLSVANPAVQDAHLSICSGDHAAGFTFSKDIQQFFRAHHPVAVPAHQFGVFLVER